jgi:predicted flap endonuclease-1-like 5' DNA nuclease
MIQMSETRIGVSGGEGGIPIKDYVIPAGARIREVQVTSGWFVDSIQVAYVDAGGSKQALPGFGGNGAEEHQFALEEDEYLVGISGRSAQYLDSIRFHTNRRVSPTYGGDGGDAEYSFLAPEGSEVVGFFGSADWYVDAIGIITRTLPAASKVTPVSQAAPEKAAAQAPKPAKSKKTADAPKAGAVAEKPAKPAEPSKKTMESTTAPAETKLAPDANDLKIIEGIGPKIAELLAQHGIATFAALAETPATQLRAMLLAAGRRFAVTDPTTWPEQAAIAAKGDMEALKALQDGLKGGRKTK